jgi:hypothetical protein
MPILPLSDKLIIQRKHHIFEATKMKKIEPYYHCTYPKFQIHTKATNRSTGSRWEVEEAMEGRRHSQLRIDGVDDNKGLVVADHRLAVESRQTTPCV